MTLKWRKIRVRFRWMILFILHSCTLPVYFLPAYKWCMYSDYFCSVAAAAAAAMVWFY